MAITKEKKIRVPGGLGNATPAVVPKGITFSSDSGINQEGTAEGSSAAPNLIEKEITANGEYPASADGADGFSKVIVDVESSGGDLVGERRFVDVPAIDKITTSNEYQYFDLEATVALGAASGVIKKIWVYTNDETQIIAFGYVGDIYLNGELQAEDLELPIYNLWNTVEGGDAWLYEDLAADAGMEVTKEVLQTINITKQPADEVIASFLQVNTNAVGGACSGKHIIEVEELPATGEEGTFYRVEPQFTDVAVYLGVGDTGFVGFGEFYKEAIPNCSVYCYSVSTKPATNIHVSDMSIPELALYYVESENDVFLYDASAGWLTFAEFLDVELTFGGIISDISQATSPESYYALEGVFRYFQYENGSWIEYLIPNGTIELDAPGEHNVSGFAKAIVSTKNMPVSLIVDTVGDLPTDVGQNSLAIVRNGSSGMSQTWIPCPWNTSNGIMYSGGSIWTDGTNYYYSNYDDQFVFNRDTNAWDVKKWYGLPSGIAYGSKIWTDGTNFYVSDTYGDDNYVLDRETDTWSVKTWNGFSPTNGLYIWTDGTNIYYSKGDSQYVLDVATSTWTAKTWNGLTSFDGDCVWTDGTNYYYSNEGTQYVLNGDTWEEKAWNGLSSFYGSNVWTDGTKYYYSKDDAQYVRDGDSWLPITWAGLTSFSGADIWLDGETVYLVSYAKSHWILAPAGTLYAFSDRQAYSSHEWRKVCDLGVPNLIAKTITKSGTYTSSDEKAHGFSSVTVSIPTSFVVDTFEELPTDAISGSFAIVLGGE